MGKTSRWSWGFRKVIQTQTCEEGKGNGLESINQQGQWEKRADRSWGFEGKVVKHPAASST